MKKDSRIFIASHSSMVAAALLLRLRQEGFTRLLVRSPSQLDLTNQMAVRSFFKTERPEYCFLTPIKEGGIGANIAYPAELVYQNLTTQTNIIHSAWKSGVKKLLFFASSCIYPRDCVRPMKEEDILRGPLEPTNEPFSVSKIAGIRMCQAYNKQFGTNFISVVPATVFGPGDNFDFETSHVIPALIRKFCEAKIQKKYSVTIWGTGKPRREFIYVDDLADAALFLMENSGPIELINAGTGVDVSILELAEKIKEIVGFEGRLEQDANKPDGVLKKALDVHCLSSLGWNPKVDLQSGLETTCRWYLEKILKKT